MPVPEEASAVSGPPEAPEAVDTQQPRSEAETSEAAGMPEEEQDFSAIEDIDTSLLTGSLDGEDASGASLQGPLDEHEENGEADTPEESDEPAAPDLYTIQGDHAQQEAGQDALPEEIDEVEMTASLRDEDEDSDLEAAAIDSGPAASLDADTADTRQEDEPVAAQQEPSEIVSDTTHDTNTSDTMEQVPDEPSLASGTDTTGEELPETSPHAPADVQPEAAPEASSETTPEDGYDTAAAASPDEDDQKSRAETAPGHARAAISQDTSEDMGSNASPARVEDTTQEEDELLHSIPDHVLTPTLADLYYQQGQTGLARNVFQRLLQRNPDNEKIKQRLREIEQGGEQPQHDDTASGGAVTNDGGQSETYESQARQARRKRGKARKKNAQARRAGNKPLKGVRIKDEYRQLHKRRKKKKN
jgi:hypothetical protein